MGLTRRFNVSFVCQISFAVRDYSALIGKVNSTITWDSIENLVRLASATLPYPHAEIKCYGATRKWTKLFCLSARLLTETEISSAGLDALGLSRSQ